MSRRILNIVILFLCSFLTSCLGVFYIDLGNHYAWIESREVVKITEEKDNALYYDEIIYPQVLNYNYDDQYIIVYQVYDGSDYYDILAKQDKAEKDSLYAQFDKIKEIKRILVYTFIYEGAANWQQVDGKVRINISGQEEILINMDEYKNGYNMCALIMLQNVNDTTFSVEKLVRYFQGHEKMDRAYNWGMRWVPGRK